MSILSIARNTYKEAIRDKILYVILLFSGVMIISSLLLSSLSLGQNDKIIVDLGLATISLFGVLITLFVGTSLLHKEIEKKTIYLLLTKPLRRSDFIIGKHIGLSMTLFVIIALMTLCFYALLLSSRVEPSYNYLEAIALSYMELVLLIAVAILFSTFSSPIISSMYTLGVYVIGHLSRDLVALGEMTKNENFIMLTKAIYYILPDLEKFNIKNIVLYSPTGISPEIFSTGLVYGLIYTAMVLTLSVIIFEFKDF